MFVSAHLINRRRADEGKQSAIPTRAPFPYSAPHAAYALVREHRGEGVIRSSLDATLQRDLEALVARSAVNLKRDAQIAILAVQIDGRAVRARVVGAEYAMGQCAGGCIALYHIYESEGRARKTINAQDLWFAILESQIETGTPYILYKDACNN